jgi:hypothetical protein
MSLQDLTNARLFLTDKLSISLLDIYEDKSTSIGCMVCHIPPQKETTLLWEVIVLEPALRLKGHFVGRGMQVRLTFGEGKEMKID